MSKKIETVANPLEGLTHEEYVARYQANQAEVKRLREENQLIHNLDEALKAKLKVEKTNAKLAQMKAELEALQNGTKPVKPSKPVVEETVLESVAA